MNKLFAELPGTCTLDVLGFGTNGLAGGVNGNAAPLASLWVFLVGPLAGAALAAIVYQALED